MSGANFLSKLRSVMRRRPSDLDLSDTVPIDFPDDLVEDETPRFNHLKVVVSGEMSDYSSGAPSNGVSVSTLVVTDDDDSLLESSSSLGSPGLNMDPCDNCTKKREKIKHRRVMKKLWIAAILYLLFMMGEIIGGYLSNSLAIMTDAVHMLTDLIGIFFSLMALWLSNKPPTNRFTFGLHRLEVLSAVVSVALIYILTAVLIYEAVQRTVHQNFDINGDVMLITAASSHVDQKQHGSLAVRAAFIHALGDLFQSVGVLVAAYVVRFKPELKLADPICTYVFSVLVLVTTVRIIRDTVVIVLEGVPRHLDTVQIKEDLLNLEDVQSVDELNIWSLTTDKTAALVHLQLTPSSHDNWEDVQAKARHLLLHTYGLSRCTVQVQTHRERPVRSCANCRQLTA
uniref:Uncharacterized protein n=1 Tax=Mola mola TaxID=94237 RepID=A0A3Q3XRW2_MOLML